MSTISWKLYYANRRLVYVKTIKRYDCIKVFSETDFTNDLKTVEVPVLVLHGEDDQIVLYATTAEKAVALLQNGRLILYPGLSHGMPTINAEMTTNSDMLDFITS